jgi:integrase
MDDVKANSRRRSEEAIGKLPLEQAAAVWLETRRPFLAPRTLKDYQEYIRTLAKFFGEMRFSEIDAEQIRAYQQMRITTAGSGRINQECGIIQQILKRIGRWSEVEPDFQPLPVTKDRPGRALDDHQRDRLFRVAASKPHWEMALLFAIISVNTTAGPKECWTLRHQDINLEERYLRVQPDGAKNRHRIRIIPLNDAALGAVQRAIELAHERGSVLPHHFIFPFRLAGNAWYGRYDPERHCTTCKSAWRKLTAAAGLAGLRPYDMRHTAITDLLSLPEASEETVKAIAGHISDRILKTYSHIRMDTKRAALAALACRSRVERA